jgi:hypothetical protein
MHNAVTWWKPQSGDGKKQNDRTSEAETPGDLDAPDIVSRTGEEMPEVSHDQGHHGHEGPPPAPPDER